MKRAFGKVFIGSDGSEYGAIRVSHEPFPEDLSNFKILAEDECGNYFIGVQNGIYFWDHETAERELLANSLEDFLAGCCEPSEVELKPGQVESAWIDPEFAKQLGIKP